MKQAAELHGVCDYLAKSFLYCYPDIVCNITETERKKPRHKPWMFKNTTAIHHGKYTSCCKVYFCSPAAFLHLSK